VIIEKQIGNYSKKQAQKYLIMGIISLVPYAILYLTSVTRLPTYINVGSFETLRGLLMGISIMVGAFYFWKPFGTYKSGLDGEKFVENYLSKKLKSDEYSIFEDVLLLDGKKGNIDHILVGPTGIFVIETKNNKHTILFDGKLWHGIAGNPSQQLFSNTLRIKDIMKRCEAFNKTNARINSLLVFSNPKANLQLPKGNPPYCVAVNLKDKEDPQLSNLITDKSQILSVEDITSIKLCLWRNIGNRNN
jgi:hypothetical protein